VDAGATGPRKNPDLRLDQAQTRLANPLA